MPDKTIECKEGQNCLSGGAFVFTEKDQAFFNKMGFTEPRRCKPCRARKKASNGGGSYEKSN